MTLWPDWTVADYRPVWAAVNAHWFHPTPNPDYEPPMPYRPNDRVTATSPIVIDLPDATVRIPAGLVLTVLDARGSDIRVTDVDTAAPVWVPAKFFARAG